MKVGILTFHWATNYGAVLQSYALQQYLVSHGHDVKVIDYKPSKFDSSLWKKWLLRPNHIPTDLMLLKREKLIDNFRKKYLQLSDRYYSRDDLKLITNQYDAFISGSDQILNPSFTLSGEGVPTDVYYLGFVDNPIKRIGYAVSFGFINYPQNALLYAKNWINNFDFLSCREQSGPIVLDQFSYEKPYEIVPDPTILYGLKLFEDINLPKANITKKGTCIYLLGRDKVSTRELKLPITNVDERHKAISLEEWLICIRDSECLVTNSYHGMIMAILFHTSFIVIGKNGLAAGQNDRMLTVLSRLGLQERLITNKQEDISVLLNKKIDWNVIDEKLQTFRKAGVDFLHKAGL